MRVSVETTSPLARKATIAVPSATFEERVAAGLRDAAGDLKLPGFRPGKVPMKEVRRRLDPRVRGQVAKELSIASFSEAMREQPFTLATQAEIEIVNLRQGADLEFIATFEVLPDVEVAALDKLTVRRPRAVIEEADIDFTIEQMRLQKRDWRPVERPVQDGDRVVVDYLLRRGEEVLRERAGWTVVLEAQPHLDALKRLLIGVAPGETQRALARLPTPTAPDEAPAQPADAPLTLPDSASSAAVVAGVDEDAEEALDDAPAAQPEASGEPGTDAGDNAPATADAEAAASVDDTGAPAPATPDADRADGPGPEVDADGLPMDVTTELTVLSVEEAVLPAVDDAFFDWFGVEAGDDRPARFRAAVRERMAVELRAAERRATSDEVLAALVDAHDFDLPPTLVAAEAAAQMERLGISEVPQELALAARQAAERRLRGQLLMREIALLENLTPDDARIRTRIDEIASAYEEAAEVRRALFADEQQLQRIESMVLQDQVLERVLALAQTSPVNVPYHDLVAGKPLPPRAEADPPAGAQADAEPAAGTDDDTPPAADAAAPAQPEGPSSGLLGRVKRLFRG